MVTIPATDSGQPVTAADQDSKCELMLCFLYFSWTYDIAFEITRHRLSQEGLPNTVAQAVTWMDILHRHFHLSCAVQSQVLQIAVLRIRFDAVSFILLCSVPNSVHYCSTSLLYHSPLLP